MRVVRIFAGADGESHFEDIEFPFKVMQGSQRTDSQPATGVYFGRVPPGHVIDWHPAPRRQFTVTLQGQAEIEVGDGTVRRIGPGDIVLADDLTGRGNVTRAVGHEDRIIMYIQLPQ